MAKEAKSSKEQRPIDKAVGATTEDISKKASFISNRQIAAWKAYIIIFFIAGFSTALVWAGYYSFYAPSMALEAINPVQESLIGPNLQIFTTYKEHAAGEEFESKLYIDTKGQNIVSTFAVLGCDPSLVQVSSLNISTTSFPYEVYKNIDIQTGKVVAAWAKPTPGVNAPLAELATLRFKALKGFTSAHCKLKFLNTDAKDDCAAILDDGKGTNVLGQVYEVFAFEKKPDTTAPVISSGSPSGELPATTTSALLSITVNEQAACKYSQTAGTAYEQMSNEFSIGANPSQSSSYAYSSLIRGLAAGKQYAYYAKCKDGSGNITASDYKVAFSIKAYPLPLPSLSASVSASPSYGVAPLNGVDFTAAASSTLDPGITYSYYFYCGTTSAGVAASLPSAKFENQTAKTYAAKDICSYSQAGTYYPSVRITSGNLTAEAKTVVIVQQGDITPPIRSQSNVSLPGSIGINEFIVTMATNENAVCRYATSSGIQYSAMPIAFVDTGMSYHVAIVPIRYVIQLSDPKIYVRCTDANQNVNSDDYPIAINLGLLYTGGQSPYPGPRPALLPETIEAENFDNGGQGVSYYDTSSKNDGGAYRSTPVDIGTVIGGGYYVGYARKGEWLEYSAYIPTAGTYDFEAKVSAGRGYSGLFRVEVNGVNKTGTLTIPSTGNWQTWTTVKKAGISLNSGTATVRLYFEGTAPGANRVYIGNFDNFKFIKK